MGHKATLGKPDPNHRVITNQSVKRKAERHTWEGDLSALFLMVWNKGILLSSSDYECNDLVRNCVATSSSAALDS